MFIRKDKHGFVKMDIESLNISFNRFWNFI